MTIRDVQWLRVSPVKRRFERTGAPQFALAYFARISEANLSLWFAGRKLMTGEAQQNLDDTLKFFEWSVSRFAPAPVDFSNIPAMERLLKEYEKLHEPEELISVAKAASK